MSESKGPEDFVPQVLHVDERRGVDGARGYGTMLVELLRCGGCERWMVEPLDNFKPFPAYFRVSFEAQCKAAGWGIHSYATKSVGGKELPLCVDCQKADLGSFTCALCEQTRPSSEIAEAYGYDESTDRLCKPCYATVPAKVWDEKCEALEKAHQYDHC